MLGPHELDDFHTYTVDSRDMMACSSSGSTLALDVPIPDASFPSAHWIAVLSYSLAQKDKILFA